MNVRLPGLKFLAFALVCLGFAAWIVSVIGNISLEDRTPYSAEFDDVTGLLVNDAVKISGVTVGKVTGIRLAEGGQPVVDFEVRDDIELGEDTRAEIRWRDVLGLRFLYVEPLGDGTLAAEALIPNERTSAPADLGVLLERLTPVMRALDPAKGNQVVEALSEALVGRVDEVRDLISDGASLTQALASRDEQIRRLIGNAATVVDAYANRADDLQALLDNLADVGETLAGRNDELERAIVAIADNQDELGRMVDANDEELRAALDALEEITRIIAVNPVNFEDILRYSGEGVVAYHRISAIGQFFNINAVGVSVDYQTISAQRGGELPQPNEGRRRASANLGAFFGSLQGARS